MLISSIIRMIHYPLLYRPTQIQKTRHFHAVAVRKEMGVLLLSVFPGEHSHTPWLSISREA